MPRRGTFLVYPSTLVAFGLIALSSYFSYSLYQYKVSQLPESQPQPTQEPSSVVAINPTPVAVAGTTTEQATLDTEETNELQPHVAGLTTTQDLQQTYESSNSQGITVDEGNLLYVDLYQDGTYFTVRDHTHDFITFDSDKNVTLKQGSTLHVLGTIRDTHGNRGNVGDVLTSQGNTTSPRWQSQQSIISGALECDNCLTSTQIEDIYVSNSGDTVNGELIIQGGFTAEQGATLKNPITLGTVQYTFPGSDGQSNYVLSTDGSGTLTWISGGSSSIEADSLDFLHLEDTLDLDAALVINTSGHDITFNEDGADSDFRIEGDTNANLFFVDASTDRVGIGTGSPVAPLTIRGQNSSNEFLDFYDSSGMKLGDIRLGAAVGNTATRQLAFNMPGVTGENGQVDNWAVFRFGGANNKIFLGDTGAVSWIQGGSGHPLYFGTGTAVGNTSQIPAMVIHTTRNVSIGTASDIARLGIEGITATTKGLVVRGAASQSANLTEWQDSSAVALSYIDANGGMVINEQGAANADFRIEGDTNANLFFVDVSTDRVGIGTGSPTTLLTLNGNTDNMFLEFDRTANASINTKFGLGVSFIASGDDFLHIGRDGVATDLVVSDDGFVGIGTTALPTELLQVGAGYDRGFGNIGVISDSSGVAIGIEENSGDESWGLGVNSAGDLNFFDTDTSTVRIAFQDDGNVGIGTTSPGAKLNVLDDASTTLTDFTQNTANAGALVSSLYTSGNYLPGLFWNTTNNNPTKPKGGIWMQTNADGSDLFLGTSGDYSTGITNTALVINQSGYVGIGTTGPIHPLQVNGVIASFQDSDWNGLQVGENSSVYGAFTWRNSNNRLDIVTAGFDYPILINNSVFVDTDTNAGNVGIGTTSPGTPLHVVGNGNTFRLEGTNHAYIEFYPHGPATRKAYLGYAAGGSNDFTIANDITGGNIILSPSFGNVGIGDASPDASLEIVNDGVGDSFLVADTNDGDTTPFVIQSDGDVGIGTASPNFKLHVIGSTYTDNLTISTGGKILRNGDSGHYINMLGDGSTYVRRPNAFADYVALGVQAASNNVALFYDNKSVFYNTGTEAMRIEGGNVGIGTTSPAAKLDIGLATNDFTEILRLYNEINSALDGSYISFDNSLREAARIGAIRSAAGTDDLVFYTNNGTISEKMRIDGAGNVGLGTTSFGTNAAKVLALGNGTAPTTSITDGIQIYAEDVTSSSELKVRDEAGNITTLSPHNFSLFSTEDNDYNGITIPWSFYSKNTDKGQEINVDMLGAIQAVESLSGKQFVYARDTRTGADITPSTTTNHAITSQSLSTILPTTAAFDDLTTKLTSLEATLTTKLTEQQAQTTTLKQQIAGIQDYLTELQAEQASKSTSNQADETQDTEQEDTTDNPLTSTTSLTFLSQDTTFSKSVTIQEDLTVLGAVIADTLSIADAVVVHGLSQLLGGAVFGGHVQASGPDITGSVTIPSDYTWAKVEFSEPFSSAPKVLASPVGSFVTYRIRDITTTGFVIEITGEFEGEATFTWFAIEQVGDGAAVQYGGERSVKESEEANSQENESAGEEQEESEEVSPSPTPEVEVVVEEAADGGDAEADSGEEPSVL